MGAHSQLRHGALAAGRSTFWVIPRRTAVVAIAAVVLVAAAVLLLADTASSPHRVLPTSVQPIARSIPRVAPSTVLTEQPWVGSACPGPHSAAAVKATPEVPLCDRIGLGINLRTPAVTATASINGQSFKLDNATESDPLVHGKHRYLAGFLQHAAFLKRGPFTTVKPYRGRITIEHVHLVIEYGAGRKLQTSLTELGYGGWG